MKMVEVALGHPLELRIAKTELRASAGANPFLTLCAEPGGCHASLRVIPGSLSLRRLAPNAAGKSVIAIDARVEILAERLAYVAGDAGHPERDCRVDLRFMDHGNDVCQNRQTSWAKATNPYNTGDTGWSQTTASCNAFCQHNGANEGRSIGATMTFGVDDKLGFPEMSFDDIRFDFGSSARCPAQNDLRVFHPNRDWTCADGTKRADCKVFEQSILKDAPLSCLSLTYAYDVAVLTLLDSVRASAKAVINQQIKKAMSVDCTTNADCALGATCAQVTVADGYPSGCTDKCLFQPVVKNACNIDGEATPPLAGFEREVNLGTLNQAYTPDNAGPLKIIAAVGGYAKNDTPDGDTAGGLNIGGFFGIDTARASCVVAQPPPALKNVSMLQLPEIVSMWDAAQQTMLDKDYHVAVSVHENALAQAAHAMYTNGALCLTFRGSADYPLNSKILSALIPSLDALDLQEVRPSFMYVYPQSVPRFSIGEGHLHRENGERVVDSPHAELSVADLRIEFYSMVRERYVRIVSVNVDFDAGLMFEIADGNKVFPVASDLRSGLKNVRVKNVEMLEERTEELEKSLPLLMDFALPVVTELLTQGFPLPDPDVLPGYTLKVQGLRGMSAIMGSSPPRYEFLTAFGTLARTTGPTRETEAPPVVKVEVQARDGQANITFASEESDLEYTYRINGGLYSMFTDARALRIERPVFGVDGPHQIEVRARRKGDPESLGPATGLTFMAEKTKPALQEEQRETRATGCQSPGAPSGGAMLMLLWMLMRRRRRR
jgi:hypothetical protein